MEYKRERKRLNPRFVALCVIVVVLAVAVLVTLAVKVFQSIGGGKPDAKDVALPGYVTEALLTPNGWSRPETPLEEIKGVVIHYVGNPGTSAEANRNYFESLQNGTEDIYASAHFIVGLEGEVLQCIPLTEWAYASNTRNEDTISIEVCHPDETGAFSAATYDRVVELTAWLCHTFDLKSADVIRHYDVSGKDCPKYYVEYPEEWQNLLTDVDEAMAALTAADEKK